MVHATGVLGTCGAGCMFAGSHRGGHRRCDDGEAVAQVLGGRVREWFLRDRVPGQ